MTTALDFSVLTERLDTPLCALKDNSGNQLVVPSEVSIWTPKISLRECLSDMYQRHARVSLVSFPNGVPGWTITEGGTDQAKEVQKTNVSKSPATDSVHSVAPTSSSCSSYTPSVVDVHISTVSSQEEQGDTDGPYRLKQLEEKLTALDMRDVVHVVVDLYHQYRDNNFLSEKPPEKNFITTVLDLFVGDVANVSRRNTIRCIKEASTLRYLLQQFEKAQWVFICTTSGEDDCIQRIRGLFTVIDFMDLLSRLTLTSHAQFHRQRSHKLHSPVDTTLKPRLTPLDTWTATMVKIAAHPALASKAANNVEICFEDEPLLFVLNQLNRTGFSAIPVVARENPRTCVGVFSSRDVQTILLRPSSLAYDVTTFEDVSVLDCLCSIRQLEDLAKARYSVIHVRDDASLDTVMRKLLASNVRRLILMDSEGKMTAVLSVTDLGRFIARAIA